MVAAGFVGLATSGPPPGREEIHEVPLLTRGVDKEGTMPLIRRTVTPKEIAARHRNARKSTGPRTERGKRQVARNGSRAAAVRLGPLYTMQDLEEKPDDYQQLLEGLRTAFQPANPAEGLLVEDIALLHLRKRRNQQAQQGLIRKSLGRLARERSERLLEITQESSSFSHKQADEIGLANIDDSPAKFKELTRLLDMVSQEVDRGEFSEEGGKLLFKIFGPNPSMRAARIIGFYSHCRDCVAGLRPPDGGEEGGSACGPADSEADLPAAYQSDDGYTEDDQRILNKSIYDDLRAALLEERLLTGKKYERYLDEHVRSFPAVRAEALAPSESEWRMLLRQEQLLDQQLERKTRLLLFMQWVRQKSARTRTPYIVKKAKLVCGVE